MHARPSAVLVKALARFESEVTVECHSAQVSAKSILGIMSLAAGYNSELTFQAVGRDAHKALATVQDLFETQFSEAYKTRDPARSTFPRVEPRRTEHHA